MARLIPVLSRDVLTLKRGRYRVGCAVNVRIVIQRIVSKAEVNNNLSMNQNSFFFISILSLVFYRCASSERRVNLTRLTLWVFRILSHDSIKFDEDDSFSKAVPSISLSPPRSVAGQDACLL